MKKSLIELQVVTPDGEFTARYSEKGLVELDFAKTGRVSARAGKNKIVSAGIRGWQGLVEAARKKVLSGRKPGKLPPLDWGGKTEFQKSVWRALLKITSGKTKNYGEIAALIGKPKAVRAVGGACGANPIPVLVPCHRVLAVNKKLGGFSGGLAWKRTLLAREGVKV